MAYYVQYRLSSGRFKGQWRLSNIVKPQPTIDNAKAEVTRLKSMGSTLELRVVDEQGKTVE